MCETENFSFLSADGIHQIQCRLWMPACPPRGVVQLVHGVAEHMGRYEDTARFLTGHGFAVCGEDHLGHGRTASDGKFGYFGPKNGWSLLVRDIAQLRQRMGRRFPGIPYFILGHSMGSFLTRTYLIQYPGTVHGAILSGTGQEAPALVSMGQALSALLCRLKGPDYVSDLVYSLSLGNYNRPFRPNRTDSDWLSRDEASVDAFLADPLCGFHPTVGMFRDMLENQEVEDKKEEYIQEFKSHFAPQAGFAASYQITVAGKRKPFIIEVSGAESNCYYGTAANPDVEIQISHETMDDIIYGRMTFQRAFMGGSIKVKGDFKILRTLDQIFPFMEYSL